MAERIDGAPVAAVRVEGLTKRYGAVTAVDAVDFQVPAGATVALLGGNGAGKTTTIAMLLGLLEPSGGRIAVLGHDMPRQRHRALAAMNFSSPYVDLPHRLSVRQNLVVYGHLFSLADVIERLQLHELADRPAGGLSAGQKTRVALAKALLNEPLLLLLDEPTASLDPDTADWVRTLLESYRRRTGATILLASHNMAEVERLADDVLMMKQGRIVDRGQPAELVRRYGRATLEEVFLDIARGQGLARRAG